MAECFFGSESEAGVKEAYVSFREHRGTAEGLSVGEFGEASELESARVVTCPSTHLDVITPLQVLRCESQ